MNQKLVSELSKEIIEQMALKAYGNYVGNMPQVLALQAVNEFVLMRKLLDAAFKQSEAHCRYRECGCYVCVAYEAIEKSYITRRRLSVPLGKDAAHPELVEKARDEEPQR
jgi:hypothetical protein